MCGVVAIFQYKSDVGVDVAELKVIRDIFNRDLLIMIKQLYALPRIEFIFQALFRRTLECPHCDSKNTSIIDSKYYVIKIRQCNECLLNFTDPVYKPSIATGLYNGLYQTKGVTDLPSEQDLIQIKKKKYDYGEKNFGNVIRKLQALTPGKDLLELGSSWGYFLQQANDAGFNASGVEISNDRASFGKEKLELDIVTNIEKIRDNQFDIVFTHHVLEHFTNLNSIFCDLCSKLRPGGLLVIAVPNFDYEYFGTQCLNVIGAVHPLGFNSNFFIKNLPHYGFDQIRFFENWDSIPENPLKKSVATGLICISRKKTTFNSTADSDRGAI